MNRVAAFTSACILVCATSAFANPQGAEHLDSSEAPSQERPLALTGSDAECGGECDKDAIKPVDEPVTEAPTAPTVTTPPPPPVHQTVGDMQSAEQRAAAAAIEPPATEPQEVGVRPLGIGFNLRGYVHNLPNFALGIFLVDHPTHWANGPRFTYGGEFVFRRNDKTDYILGIDYADYRTADGWWLEKDEPIASADWVENNLRALNITFEWNGIANLDRKRRAQIYGGVGIGLALRFGNFRKYDIPTGCFNRNTDIGLLDSLAIDAPCPDLPGSDVLLNGDPEGEAQSAHNEKIPRVLPAFVATLGFRYIIADIVSVGIEGGIKTASFYGGLEIGFILGKREAPSAATP